MNCCKNKILKISRGILRKLQRDLRKAQAVLRLTSNFRHLLEHILYKKLQMKKVKGQRRLLNRTRRISGLKTLKLFFEKTIRVSKTEDQTLNQFPSHLHPDKVSKQLMQKATVLLVTLLI